ncbi:MAG TPA: murein biosynthesis integral membrane protein MurJ [Steroidobacteraceae bacterium]|nr:murein biosynthesis integral membrane protein MurJ [Steroidobacteraceae bacterium]
MTASTDRADRPASGRIASTMIAAGIFLSRIAGLVRERLVAMCFGTGLHADVFGAALRMPNVLQNLLGEGTLSASFIPVYSELLGKGRNEEAGRVAGAMFALLLAVAGGIALLGIVFAPGLVTLFTPGFEGQRRELMIALVRILFPMTGVLVLSAWTLGILNSHRRFFVPYFAPVLWNVAIIAVLFGYRHAALDKLLMAAAWGALLGGVLQFSFQLPFVLKVERNLRIGRMRSEAGFREAVSNAGPAILGRGVVQLSGYVDMVLASLLAIGAVARLRYAQTLYVLPVSLFGMSIAAAELPELARAGSGAAEALRERLIAAVRRVSFYVVPSLVAFVVLGQIVVAGVYQSGHFGSADATLVWYTLMAYSLGLLASTNARVYQSAFYALRDTRTTARIAMLRVLVSAICGCALMLQFEPVALGTLHIPAGVLSTLRADGLPLGPLGLATGATLGAWFEWTMLRRALARRIGSVGAGAGQLLRMFTAAALAAALAYALSLLLRHLHPLPMAACVGATYGAVYFAAARALGLAEAVAFSRTLKRRFGRRA